MKSEWLYLQTISSSATHSHHFGVWTMLSGTGVIFRAVLGRASMQSLMILVGLFQLRISCDSTATVRHCAQYYCSWRLNSFGRA